MLITVDLVMLWGPCEDWPRERIAEVLGDGLTPLNLAKREDISMVDRLWTLLHREVLGDWLPLVACDFAENALRRKRAEGQEPDRKSWKALEVARAWVRGEATNEDLKKVRYDVLPPTSIYYAVLSVWYVGLFGQSAGCAYLAAAAATNSAGVDWRAEMEWQLNRVVEVLEAMGGSNGDHS